MIGVCRPVGSAPGKSMGMVAGVRVGSRDRRQHRRADTPGWFPGAAMRHNHGRGAGTGHRRRAPAFLPPIRRSAWPGDRQPTPAAGPNPTRCRRSRVFAGRADRRGWPDQPINRSGGLLLSKHPPVWAFRPGSRAGGRNAWVVAHRRLCRARCGRSSRTNQPTEQPDLSGPTRHPNRVCDRLRPRNSRQKPRTDRAARTNRPTRHPNGATGSATPEFQASPNPGHPDTTAPHRTNPAAVHARRDGPELSSASAGAYRIGSARPPSRSDAGSPGTGGLLPEPNSTAELPQPADRPITTGAAPHATGVRRSKAGRRAARSTGSSSSSSSSRAFLVGLQAVCCTAQNASRRRASRLGGPGHAGSSIIVARRPEWCVRLSWAVVGQRPSRSTPDMLGRKHRTPGRSSFAFYARGAVTDPTGPIGAPPAGRPHAAQR